MRRTLTLLPKSLINSDLCMARKTTLKWEWNVRRRIGREGQGACQFDRIWGGVRDVTASESNGLVPASNLGVYLFDFDVGLVKISKPYGGA